MRAVAWICLGIVYALATRPSTIETPSTNHEKHPPIQWDTLIAHDIIPSMNLRVAELMPLLRVSKATRDATFPFTTALVPKVQKHLVRTCGQGTFRKLYRSVFMGIMWPVQKLSSKCYTAIAHFCQRHRKEFAYAITMTITNKKFPYSNGLFRFLQACPESIRISGHRNNHTSVIIKNLQNSYVRKIALEKLTDDPLDELSNVLMSTSLNEVVLRDVPFGMNLNFECLAQSLPASNLTRLVLDNVYINETMLDLFYSAVTSSGLIDLQLSSNQRLEKTHVLFRSLPYSRIQSFSVRENWTNFTVLANSFTLMTRLKKLVLKIQSSIGMAYLTRSLIQSDLTDLMIETNYLSRAAFQNVASIISAGTLTNLSLSSLKFSSEGFDEFIRKGLNGSNIISLNLTRLPLYDHNKMELLASVLPHLPHLRVLYLAHCRIDQVGMQSLASYLPLTSITHLDISHNINPFQTSDAFFDILPLTHLASLSTQSNEISNESGVKLASILPDTQISHLDLSHNNLGLEFILKLTSVLPSTFISHLSIAYNLITPPGLVFLTSNLPIGCVTYLDIRGEFLSDTVLERIAKKVMRRGVMSLFVTGEVLRNENGYVLERYPMAFDHGLFCRSGGSGIGCRP